MRAKIYETLEFDKIIQAVNHYSQTDKGRQMIDSMPFEQDFKAINYLQAETSQALTLIVEGRPMPIPHLESLTQSLKRLEIGAGLNGRELAEILRLLSSVRQLILFFKRLTEGEKYYPELTYWVDQAVNLPQLIEELEGALEESGAVKTSASRELSRIRRSQQSIESQIRSLLNEMLKSKRSQLSDNLITIRNNRFVLPVKAEFQGQIKGTIHGQSSTGQTLYIEPQAVVQQNNRLSELQMAEKTEIDRILFELSQQLIPYVEDLRYNESVIGQIDAIQARAYYAQAMKGTRPTFSQEDHIGIWQARHPLIDEAEVVANDIVIGENYRTLLITGPNTGGKTILLKTLGLLQLMGQSGLHIPAEEGSQLGIFDAVYADIGDEQSIEQSLSTFSSHMTNIVSILDQATDKSLLLFDELGSGTDPQEGAALAMAILNYTAKLQATVMATTHYPELKVYANETSGTINASMEFDSETLTPTYRLLIGIPGRSNALEISERLGLESSILEDARSGISTSSHSLNETLAKLERQRRQAEIAKNQAEERLKEADNLYQDLRVYYERWQKEKDQLIQKAKEAANEEVKKAQKEADQLIQEIRRMQLRQGQASVKEHELIEKQSQLAALERPIEVKHNKVLKRAKRAKELKVGDDVEVLSYGQRGTIIDKLSANEYTVQMGILKMNMTRDNLKPLKSLEEPKRRISVQRSAGSKVQTSLDLRGARYEEAMDRLGKYLDQALLSHHPQVTIIHGKGTGALRQGVHQFLNRHPQIDRFEFSPPNAGGNGSTIAYFKS